MDNELAPLKYSLSIANRTLTECIFAPVVGRGIWPLSRDIIARHA